MSGEMTAAEALEAIKDHAEWSAAHLQSCQAYNRVMGLPANEDWGTKVALAQAALPVLRAALEQRHDCDIRDAEYRAALEERDALKARVAALEEGLQRYAEHAEDCKVARTLTGPCDCGLAALLAGEGE